MAEFVKGLTKLFCLLFLFSCGIPNETVDFTLQVQIMWDSQNNSLVSLTSNNSKAQLYFSLDGTSPLQHGTLYKQPFSLWASALVRCVAKLPEQYKRSPESRLEIQMDTIPPSVWSEPSSGSFKEPIQVALFSDEKTTLYYTLDGSPPTTKAKLYFSPFAVRKDTILRFVGYDSFGNASLEQKVSFVFSPLLFLEPKRRWIREEKTLVSAQTNKPSRLLYRLPLESKDKWFSYGGSFEVQQDTRIEWIASSQDLPTFSTTLSQEILFFPVPQKEKEVSKTPTFQKILLADPFRQGNPMFVFFEEKEVFCSLKKDLTSLKSFLFSEKILWVQLWDWDGDGIEEVFIQTEKKEIQVFQIDEKCEWKSHSEWSILFSSLSCKQMAPLFLKTKQKLALLCLQESKNTTELQILLHENKQWKQEQVFSFSTSPAFFLVGDLDGDGKQDVLVVDDSNQLLFSKQLEGVLDKGRKIETSVAVPKNTVWTKSLRADWRGHGQQELVLCGKQENQFLVWSLSYQQNKPWRVTFDKTTSTNTSDCSFKDIDLDGRLDLFFPQASVVWKNVFGETWEEVPEKEWPSLFLFTSQWLGWTSDSFQQIFFPTTRNYILPIVRGNKNNRQAFGSFVQTISPFSQTQTEIGFQDSSTSQFTFPRPIGISEATSSIVFRWWDDTTQTKREWKSREPWYITKQ